MTYTLEQRVMVFLLTDMLVVVYLIQTITTSQTWKKWKRFSFARSQQARRTWVLLHVISK
jgi:hypothetical protein